MKFQRALPRARRGGIVTSAVNAGPREGRACALPTVPR
jgi:hypothetical protein